MANDSTNPGQISSEQDATPINEGYFTDMQGDADALFGPEQLAQANAGAAPVVVPVPQDQNVVRVQVNPGEILELSSPFDPGVQFLGREADGNLAIKVGDVTVILMGYVAANEAAPVVVETSDGQPIDIATLLASTDPAIDIQTAAGPGDAGQGGQGADNTGAILAQLAGGNGLSGLNAVGAQDQTELSYGNIDNSIRLDRADALTAAALSSGPSGFFGVAEAFLRDPFHTNTWLSFDDFKTDYAAYIDAHKADKGGWADFTGTQATTDDSATFFQETSFVVTVSHNSGNPEQLNLRDGLAFFNGDIPKSNGETLEAEYLSPSDHSTIVLVRPSDGAVVMVFHVQETDSTGDFHVEVYLVNRLDHLSLGQDVLTVGFHTEIFTPGSEGTGEGQPGTPGSTHEGPSGSVDIQDDIPVAHDATYLNFLHAGSFKDAADCFSAFLGGKITDVLVTHDAGHVDEDYIFHGNHDKDNATGPDSDEDRGDDKGDQFVVGQLNIDFGADGPSGKIPEGDKPTKDDPIFHDADPAALAIAGLHEGDPYPDAKSNGHDLVVLKHEMLPFPFSTVEMVQVGYTLGGTPSGEGPVASLTGEGGGCDVVVFTLLLQTGPNLPLFGGFVFEQSAPLDHDPAATLESNLPLNFQVTATDDDGDHPIDPVTIHILVNDDAPTFKVTYCNEDPGSITTFAGPGTHHDTDFGRVDEDWLTDNASITNGSFEDPIVVGDFDTLGAGSGGLTGWTIGGIGVDHIHDYWNATDGEQSVDLNSTGAGTISTEISGLTVGKTYTISFDLGGNPELDNGPKPISVDVAGVHKEYIVDTTNHSLPDVNWTTQSFTFVATSDTETLTFTSGANGPCGPVLDNVTVTPINGSGNQDTDANGYSNADQFGDDYGSTHVSGQITMKYGADGPGEQSFGLATPAAATDADGNPLTTQNGTIPLVVLNSSSEELRIGYADENGDHTVFLLTLDTTGPNAGHFDFTQFEPIDHPIASAVEDNVYLTFKAGSVTDWDGDTTDAIIKIQVNDDVPETGVSYVEVAPKTEVPVPVPETDDFTVLAVPTYGRVDEDYLAGGNKDADNSTPGSSSDWMRGDDGGYTVVTGEIGGMTKYGADGPAGTAAVAFALSGLTEEDPFLDAAGNQLKSHDHPLVVLTSNDDTLEVGYHNGDGTDTPVFRLEMTGDTTFKFELEEPLDDPQEQGDTAEQGIVLAFGAENGATDKDSDPAARIVIHVNDDAPSDCEVAYISHSGPGDPDDTVIPGAATAGVVDEAWAELTGLGNGYDDTRTGDEAGYSHATALIKVDFGADGPADGGGFAFDKYTVGDTFTDANNDSYSSGGEALVVQAASATGITVGIDGGAPIFIVSINAGGAVSFLLEGALDHPYGDEVETDVQVVLNVTATDFDGDSVDTQVTFKVNDDVPIAVNEQTDFRAPDEITGNIFDQAKKGADDGRISIVNGIPIPEGGSYMFNGVDGSAMVIFANGSWSFTPGSDDNGRPSDQTFAYTIVDGDGDTATANLVLNYTGNDGVGSRLAFVPSGPTHGPAPHYDHDVTVTGLNGIANPFDSKTYHFEDLTGGHLISGGAGNDFINVTGGTGAVLSGNGGDDIIHAGNGGAVIHGGGGDDTLFGGNNADSFFGDAGHDAMAGGAGDDTFHKVDADDLDGTNTLDGIHSIDGGTGADTVDLSVLKTFDLNQAMHLENVEHLALEGKASGGGGTMVTLNYGAAYGVTEVGGLHQLSITGDKADSVQLQGNGGNAWHETGADTHIYEAGIGAAKVTVTVDHDVNVQLS